LAGSFWQIFSFVFPLRVILLGAMNKLKGEIGKMMFMSMVVHFAEFVLMSLVGIMSYKLYVSYMSWKNACAFSASSSSVLVTEKAVNYPTVGNSSEHLNVTKVDVTLTGPVAKTPAPKIISEPLDVVKVNQSQISETKIIQTEKKSSAILNDYIGEFFIEHQAVDIDAYRVATKSTISTSDHDPVNAEVVTQSETKSKHDYIKVEPFFVVPDVLKTTSTLEESIPTLNEFSDVELDSFITVAKINSEIKSSNKVMSDKVVMAMLDEAKLVRFS
jgi:hypothetical protein